MWISTAILGGHHSPRRPHNFVSRKIALAAASAAYGGKKKLYLGNLTRSQDWGFADNFVTAFPEILRWSEPSDFIVSTGDPHTGQEFLELAFAHVGQDWREYVIFDRSLNQPTDVAVLSSSPDDRLTWRPEGSFSELVEWMVDSEL
jgi:GDPmannose 4,6-dehydratase